MTVNFDIVSELKKAAIEKFNIKIHFHDTCCGQYFTLEEDNLKIREFIENFFKQKGIEISFSKDNLEFYPKK